MRFLIVTPLVPPEPGGPSYYSVALKEALEKRGETVALRAFREVRHLPTGIRHLVFLFKVYRAARHADVLVVLDTVSVALPAVLAARLARKPAIIRTGGDFVWEQYVERTKEKVLLSEFYTHKRTLSYKERLLVWLQKRLIFPRATRVLFSSALQQDIFVQAYGIDPHRVGLVENCYGPKLQGREPSTKNFMCIYRPTEFKNIDTLERAYALLKERVPEATLEVCSDIPRSEAHEHIASAYAVVVPSLTELSPNLVLEALQFDKPVIVTCEHGLRERLGEAVVEVDPRDPSGIARAMEDLCATDHYSAQVARARAFSYVRTYDAVAEDFIHVARSIT